MPDFRDFPGLPIRTQLVMSKEGTVPEKNRTATSSDHGTEITSTITSVSRQPIRDSEFTVPNDFKEPNLPDIFEKKNTAPSVSPNR